MTSRRTLAALAAGALMGVTLAVSPASKAQDNPDNALRPASDFQSIGDATERSVALFQEAGQVIQHPRCVNCHPRTDRPLQNLAMTPHQPPVSRGDGGMGMPGMTCNTCHGAENIAVVAPMPSASVTMTRAVNAGARSRLRIAASKARTIGIPTQY